MIDMKISVVMATYNGSQFIVEQLDSIRLQTRKPDEVIICDDCSTDDTVEVVKKYISDNQLESGWKIYVNDNNLGYANNFNKATSLAEGDYVFFSDQDDTWNISKIDEMVAIMENNPQCCVLSTDYTPWYFDNSEKKAPQKVIKKMPNDGKLESIVFGKKSIYIGAIGCCMCIRGAFLDRIRDYWFDGWAQDDRMWRLSLCDDGCLILHNNELVNHRIHSNNAATYGKYHTIEVRTQLFSNMLKATEEMMRMIKDKGEVAGNRKKIKILSKHAKMFRLRIALMRKCHLLNIFPLLRYLPYYETPKSIILEEYMALRRK